MFSGVISSARSPSHTKMMTLRGVGPPGCGVAASRPNPSTTSDKMIRKMNLFIFMGDLVSFEGGRSPAALLIVQMASTTADRIAGRRLPDRGNHAATDVFWLSTVAIFCQPSTLRNLICPLATRLKSRITAESSVGSELCVFTRRRNASWSRSIVLVVRSVFLAAFPQALFHQTRD